MDIRTKDKIFLAVFIPAVVVGAYIYFWRIDAAKAVASLEARHASLVAIEDFPLEKRIRDARLEEARKELESEKATPRAEALVADNSGAAFAVRERRVMRIFREAGLVVVRSDAIDIHNGEEAAAENALTATGLCPHPTRRSYTLDGSYPAVKKALDTFCGERLAAIAERISMRPSGYARWTIDVWL